MLVHLNSSVVSLYFRPVVEDLDEDPPPDVNLPQVFKVLRLLLCMAGKLLRVAAKLPGEHDTVPLDDVTQADLRLDRVPVIWKKEKVRTIKILQ